MTAFPVAFVRSRFPGLARPEVFFDNAGGSFALESVADRVRDYLLHTPVQLGATYATSAAAAERYRAARARIAELAGAGSPDEVVFGPSSTILLKLLAAAFEPLLAPGDEIIVTRADHEANIGPWLELAQRRGATVRFWELDAEDGLGLAGLHDLLGPRTRLVAVTHVSNVLGTIHPIAAITQAAHAAGARVCVDGVAYAPHRQLELAGSGADYYVFSLYKVYGPHHAVLYAPRERLLELGSVNHHFFTRDQVPGKLEPGNANYELAWGAAAVVDYLEELGRECAGEVPPAAARTAAWRAIAAHEEALAARLLAFLRDRDGVAIHGCPDADPERRVPTVSFSCAGRHVAEVVAAADAHGIGIRYGHFYAPRLIEALGLADRGGVVRVSMVHYNTLDEVDRLIGVLDAEL